MARMRNDATSSKRTMGAGCVALLVLLLSALLGVNATAPQSPTPPAQQQHTASYTPEYRAAAAQAARAQNAKHSTAATRASAAAWAQAVQASSGLIFADAFGKALAAREARLAQSDNVFDKLQHSAFSAASKLVSRPAPSERTTFTPLSNEGGLAVIHPMAGGFPSGPPDFGKFELTDEQKAEVVAKYSTDPAALKMHDQSPRFGPSKMVFVAGSNDPKDPYGIGISSYVWGVALCFVIGIGIAFFQLFLTGLYMCLRVCVWRWCCKKRSDHEKDGFPGWPTPFKKYWPVVSAFVCIALACAFAVVGIVFNNGVSKTFSTTDQDHGVAPLVLNAMSSLDDKINAIVNVINGMTSEIPAIGNAITSTSNKIGDLSTASNALTTAATNFQVRYGTEHAPHSVYSTFNVTANGTLWVCDWACLGAGQVAGNMGAGLASGVNPVFSEFQGAINDVHDTFLSVSNQILSTLDDAKSAVNSASSGVTDSGAKKQVQDNSKTVSDYDKYRNIAFVVLFSVVFVTPVLSGLAVTSKKGWPFKCNFCLGPFYLFLIWLLFGVHWMLGMFIGDACEYMDDSLVDLKGRLTDVIDSNNAATLSSVINACLVNASLITALNLTGYLDFAHLIVFPDIPSSADINARFKNLNMSDITFQVQVLDATRFHQVLPDGGIATNGWDLNAVNNPLNDMYNVLSNTGGNIKYTRADLLSNRTSVPPLNWYTTHYTVGTDQDNVLAAESRAWDAYQIELTLTTAASAVKSDANLLAANITDLQNRLNSVVSLVSNASNPESVYATIQPLFDQVHSFEDVAYCGFIADIFGDFKSTLCDSLGMSVQFITLSLFIIGVSCFGITWFSRWSSYRVQFVPRVAPMPFDENAWMQQAGGANGNGGVQMAVVEDQQQQQQEQGGAGEYGGYTAGTASGVGLGEATYGDAVQVPPYQAALAAYNSQNEQQAEGGETGGAAVEEAPAAQQDNELASPSAAAAPAVDASSFPFGPCESCSAQPAMVTCVECDEKLCMECDNSLHMIVANAQHDRTMMA